MPWVDTHAHLQFPQFDADRDDVLARAEQAGLAWVLVPGTDAASSRAGVELARRKDRLVAAVGLHPHDVTEATAADWDEIEQLAGGPEVVAVGEIGLDYHYDDAVPEAQQAAFRRQLALARDLDKPVIVHCRKAFPDCLRILGDFAPPAGDQGWGVMHCFSGKAPEAAEALRLGLHVSFAGSLTRPTFKKLRATAKTVPLERLLLETDCPYQTPVGAPAERNEPAFVWFSAACLAELFEQPLERIAETTTKNAEELFGVTGKIRNSKCEVRDNIE